MLLSGNIDHNQDVSISRLANSIHYLIDTCFIMDVSGTDQGKTRFRLLAFHEDQNKIFVDKYFPTLRGARIAFKRYFSNRAFSDMVAPIWTDLYTPDNDWIEEMLTIVEDLKSNLYFKDT